jgi:hypothetical protein
MFSNDQQPTLAFTERYKKMGTKRKASHQSKAHKQIKHVKERYKALFNIPRLREEQYLNLEIVGLWPSIIFQ